jgi:7-cyano-7-deazaguanine synthase in queuosine biosynthesis
MHHTVIWSGGMDSTLILNDLIKKNINVDVIIFKSTFLDINKMKAESIAREKYLKHIGKTIHTNIITLNYEDNPERGETPNLFQQPLMLSLLSVLSKRNTIFYFGYHKGDDFFTFSHEILSGVEWFLSALGNKNIKFSFPLKYSTKEDIINSIEVEGLTPYTYFCELPGEDLLPCKNCTPCKTYEEAKVLSDYHKKNNESHLANLYYEYDENDLLNKRRKL